MAARPGIIYLLKDRFQLYSPFLRQIAEFKFTPQLVLDADVVDREQLIMQIKAFVTNNKIQPSNLIILLADNAYFVKDYLLPPPPSPQKPGQPPPPPPMSMETLQVMSMDFVEHVPYENVVSKSFPLKNGLKICAVNKDFFDVIKEAFESVGFTVDTILPGIALGNNLTVKPVLDGSIINAASAKATTLKEFDLQHQEVYVPQPKKGTETSVEMEIDDFEAKKGKPDKKRLYVMIGVFGVLLIILVFVYIGSNQPSSTQTAVVPTASAVKPTDVPTAVISTTQAEPSVAEEPAIDKEEAKLLTAQLTNTAASAIAVERLRKALGGFGFASMTTQSQPSLAASQTIIIFSLAPSNQMRQAVLLEVKKVTPNVQVQEKVDAPTDITILLGR